MLLYLGQPLNQQRCWLVARGKKAAHSVEHATIFIADPKAPETLVHGLLVFSFSQQAKSSQGPLNGCMLEPQVADGTATFSHESCDCLQAVCCRLSAAGWESVLAEDCTSHS